MRADAALVPFVEASNTQRVSPQVQKSLDYNLTDAEIARGRRRHGARTSASARIAWTSLPADAATRRRVFELAQDLRATTLVVPGNTAISPASMRSQRSSN